MTEPKTSEQLTKELQEKIAETYCQVCDDCGLWEYGCNLFQHEKNINPCKNQLAYANRLISTVLIPAGLVFVRKDMGGRNEVIPISEVE
jgi:hypothetical protein